MKTLRRNWDLVVALAAAATLSACSPLLAVRLLSTNAQGVDRTTSPQAVPSPADAGPGSKKSQVAREARKD
jgi:hypothetical protein